MVEKAPRKRAPRVRPTDPGDIEPVEPVTLPHAWEPYPWQRRVLDAFDAGCKRFDIVVHRRAGKDQVALNGAAIESQKRQGLYLHVFPYANQVRRAIWRGMDKSTGVRFIDQAFPEAMRTTTRDALMEIEFTNRSLWAATGSDNVDQFRSANPIGVVFSEWAFCDPDAWRVISPILRENGGWAMFITTPAGRNHAYRQHQKVTGNPDWHTEYLTVDDTVRCDGSPIITPEMIDAERADGMDEATIQREYYCAWDAALAGAYYDKQLTKLRRERRARELDLDPLRPITVAWRLSEADHLVAVAFQRHGASHHCIGAWSWDYQGYGDAVDELARCFTWNTAGTEHVIAHDGAAADAFRAAGVAPTMVAAPRPGAGVTMVREILPTTWVDTAARPWAPEGNNGLLLDALAGYRVAPPDEGMLAGLPLKSWESAYAEALALYAAAAQQGAGQPDAWGPAPDYSHYDKAVI